MKKEYMRVFFSVKNDGKPEIYDFLFKWLVRLLKKLEISKVELLIERLEPLNELYSNLSFNKNELKKVFDSFAKSHKLKETKSWVLSNEKTSLKATVDVKDLERDLKDYDLLFDVFFADIQLKTKDLFIDLMDPSSNQVLFESTNSFLLKSIYTLLKSYTGHELKIQSSFGLNVMN